MSKILNKPAPRNDGPSKIKKPTFKKNVNGPQDGQRQHKRAKGNQLKLNEFHQKVHSTQQNSFKKQMRDINRLLSKKGKDGAEGIDDTLKSKKEEELKALKKKAKESKKKRFLIKENEAKYKKIKFFEETKLRRKLKSVQNKIQSIEEGKADPGLDKEELLAEKQRIGDDLNYIKFYPMERKYIALFPAKDDEEAQAKRESMRQNIKELMGKKSVNVQKSLERLVDSLNEERNTKMDTFFEVEPEAEPKPQKKKIVDKQGRIIIAEDF